MNIHSDFAGVEAYLKNLPALTLSPTVHEQSLGGFIKNFLQEYTFTNETHVFCTKKSKGEKLGQGRWNRRTLEDIYLLCQTYVTPKPTLHLVIDELFRGVRDGYIQTWCCPDINKRTWQYIQKKDEDERRAFWGPLPTDEYGLDYFAFLNKYEISTFNGPSAYSMCFSHTLKPVDYKIETAVSNEEAEVKTPLISELTEITQL